MVLIKIRIVIPFTKSNNKIKTEAQHLTTNLTSHWTCSSSRLLALTVVAAHAGLAGQLLGGGEAVEDLLPRHRRRRGGQRGRRSRGVAQIVLLQRQNNPRQ